MKIIFTLKECIYDCKIDITDAQSNQRFLISSWNDDALIEQSIAIDIYGNEFDLTITPVMPDYKKKLAGVGDNNWKDKLAKKATNAFISSFDNAILRVGCQYHISGLQNEDIININFQQYTFGTFDRYDLLELIPMMYIFFEVANHNKRFEPINAFETNRKKVIKTARVIALSSIFGIGFLTIPFTYPIQVGRIKRLSKSNKIFKVLSNFHNMSDAERQKKLDKEDKFFNS